MVESTFTAVPMHTILCECGKPLFYVMDGQIENPAPDPAPNACLYDPDEVKFGKKAYLLAQAKAKAIEEAIFVKEMGRIIAPQPDDTSPLDNPPDKHAYIVGFKSGTVLEVYMSKFEGLSDVFCPIEEDRVEFVLDTENGSKI